MTTARRDPRNHPALTLEDLLDAKRREWSESAFDQEVVNVAAGLGWTRTCHVETVTMKGRGAGRYITKTPAAAGFPDRVFVKGGLEIVVELKDERNSPSDDQRAWLTEWSGFSPADRWASRAMVPTFAVAGGIRYVGLWRPRHWSHIVTVFQRSEFR